MGRLRSNLLLALNCSWRPLILLLRGRGAACRPLGRPALLQERVDSAAHNLLQEGRRQHNHRSLLLLLLHRQADNGGRLLLLLHRQADDGGRLLLLRRQHWQGYVGPLLPDRRLHMGQQPSCQLCAVLTAVQVHTLEVFTPTSIPLAL